jgi:hypothetical protein
MKRFLISSFAALAAMLATVSTTWSQNETITNADKEQVVGALAAQDIVPVDSSSWATGGTTALNFSQVYLQNWAAGGQSSVSATALVQLFANYKRENMSWDNTLDLAYGLLRQGDEGIVIKTDDRIDFMSKYGKKASEKWYYSGLVNFRTQFAPGYQIVGGVPDQSNIISDLLAPAYTLAALGMDFKPSPKFTAFISPVTYKLTIVMNDSLAGVGAFGVTPGENFRSEIGGYVRMGYTNDIMENVNLTTRIDLFSNYMNNPQNIDINWEMLISMKVNKFLSATIGTQLLYDHDVILQKKDPVVNDEGITVDSGRGPGVQFKEVLGIGISYKF